MNDAQREHLISLAYLYLKDARRTPTDPNRHRYGDAHAFLLLKEFEPEKYASLTEDVWSHSGIEIIKVSSFEDWKEPVEPLLDQLSSDFPELSIKIVLSQAELS